MKAPKQMSIFEDAPAVPPKDEIALYREYQEKCRLFGIACENVNTWCDYEAAK